MELAERKQLGAFYTPPPVARYLCNWAIRSRLDRVLEPSCGEAEFLVAAAERLGEIDGCLFDAPLSLTGIELNPAAAKRAAERLQSGLVQAEIRIGDFFDLAPDEKFDAIVGNPPFIRYQQFTGSARAKALRSALAEGVSLNGLASSWAAFVVHSARLLSGGGRLALVLPAELLTVKYAGPIREYLLRRFSRIQMITFEHRVFATAQEDVVLLLAEGEGPTTHFEVYPASSVACLSNLKKSRWRDFEPEGEAKWCWALLGRDELDSYKECLRRSEFCTLADWGDVYLGAVTGNNKYFTLRAVDVDEYRLKEHELRRISPPGSRHLRCTTFTAKAWEGLARSGARCYLFYPEGSLSKAARRYIGHGEEQGVQDAYKCSVREPWWRVPLVDVADLFLTYMDSERPRIVHNTARVDHLNSVYGIRSSPGYVRLAKLLPIASLNSVTTFAAEIVGRSYGGGVLKLEPREADNLPMPPASLVRSCATDLRAVEAQVVTLAGQGKLMEACEVVDRILFPERLRSQLRQIRAMRHLLRNRRQSRAAKNDRN